MPSGSRIYNLNVAVSESNCYKAYKICHVVGLQKKPVLLSALLQNADRLKTKQAGTGPSRRHIQGSKIAKGLPRVNLQYSKIKKAKKWTEWRAGDR